MSSRALPHLRGSAALRPSQHVRQAVAGAILICGGGDREGVTVAASGGIRPAPRWGLSTRPRRPGGSPWQAGCAACDFGSEIRRSAGDRVLQPTDIKNPDYFHKVVDCQWACPSHTPVPEYIRLIAAKRFGAAWAINWESNVFPGILGRTCDRPCEPACRRGRVEKEPVAICRLKRVAADNKEDVTSLLPKPPAHKNGRRVALIGAGPASLTVARDLLPLGYEVVLFDGDRRAGGMIRSQIPRFRLPETIIDEEVGYILDMGVTPRLGERVDSLKALLAESFDAVFVGTGAPRGRDLDI